MSLTLIPESHIDLLQDEVRAYAYLSTVMGDGTPQVTPVWFNTNEDLILINSAKGRVKDRNMRQRSFIAVVFQDPKTHFEYHFDLCRRLKLCRWSILNRIHRFRLISDVESSNDLKEVHSS